MKRLTFFLFLFAALSLPAQYNRAARKGTEKAAAELSAMSREIRVSRQVRDELEEQAQVVEYAVRHGQLNAAEQRKIRSVMSRIEKMLEKSRQNGRMSVNEAQRIRQDLTRAYRLIWFLRRNRNGEEQPIVFLGRRIVLRPEFRSKYDAGSLDQKEMGRILHAYYSACRIREQMRTTGLKPDHRARLEKGCFTLLSEYFTLAEPESAR